MLKASKFRKLLIITYSALVGGVWGILEAYAYFRDDSLKRMLGPYWILLYAIPLLIAVAVASVGSSKDDKAKESTQKRLTVIMVVALIVSGVMFSWYMGWLVWLQRPVTWPVGWLILYSLILLCLPALVLVGILHFGTSGKSDSLFEEKPYYTIYGARWGKSSYDGAFRRPPICDNCLMEMINLSMPDRYGSPVERWECRECGRKIEWDASKKGDLLADVTARYNAEVRQRLEHLME
jgi:hypothetical protein